MNRGVLFWSSHLYGIKDNMYCSFGCSIILIILGFRTGLHQWHSPQFLPVVQFLSSVLIRSLYFRPCSVCLRVRTTTDFKVRGKWLRKQFQCHNTDMLMSLEKICLSLHLISSHDYICIIVMIPYILYKWPPYGPPRLALDPLWSAGLHVANRCSALSRLSSDEKNFQNTFCIACMLWYSRGTVALAYASLPPCWTQQRHYFPT